MKPVVFLLVLFLSACASQNNTPIPQPSQPKPEPTKQSTQTVKSQAKQVTATPTNRATTNTNTAAPTNTATPSNTAAPTNTAALSNTAAPRNTATEEKKTAPEQTDQENSKTKVTKNTATIKKPIEPKKPDPNSFTCIYDSIYKVYAASSVETAGGKFLVTIDKDTLTVKSLSAEIPGTYHLQVKRRDQFKIFAKTKSKQFIYSVSSGNFVFNTGIGPSGFNISKGGHTGRQMRASGKCVNN